MSGSDGNACKSCRSPAIRSVRVGNQLPHRCRALGDDPLRRTTTSYRPVAEPLCIRSTTRTCRVDVRVNHASATRSVRWWRSTTISDGDQDWARAGPRARAAAGDANPRDLDVQMPRAACRGAGTGAADAGGIVPGRVLVHASAAGVFRDAASSGSSGNLGWPLVVAPRSKKSVSPGLASRYIGPPQAGVSTRGREATTRRRASHQLVNVASPRSVPLPLR